MAPPSTKLPDTALVAETVAGESTCTVTDAELSAGLGSAARFAAFNETVEALFTRLPAKLGAVTVKLRVAVLPTSRLARSQWPVAGL